MKKGSTFASVKINLEKLKLLISGSVDGNEFNDKIREIRKMVNIPEEGMSEDEQRKEWVERMMTQLDKWQKDSRKLDKSDPNFSEKKRAISKKCDTFHLRRCAEDLVASNPDLSENFIDSIIEYAKYGKSLLPIPNNYRIIIQERNGKRVPTLELYGELTASELSEAKKILEMRNQDKQYFTRHRGLEEFNKSLKIKNLSQKRGSRLESTIPDVEKDGKFTDQSIVTEIIKERLDTSTRKKTNQAQIRQKRRRIEKRAKELFPNTYKK